MLRTALISGTSFGIGIVIGSKFEKRISQVKNLIGTKYEDFDTGTAIGLLMRASEATNNADEMAVLSTIDQTGHINSRAIIPWKVEVEEGSGNPVIFFNTNLLSKKTSEMRANSNVTLTYLDQRKMAYVSWSGKVNEVKDEEEAYKHWHSSYYYKYPEGPKGERFSTWKLKPSNVKLVSIADKIKSSPPERLDWRAPEIELKGTEWHRVDI